MNKPLPTIGLLYAGEMGASLAAPLVSRGFRVVTTTAQRSDRTVARAKQAELVVLGDLGQVVRASDIVLSVVPPSSAREVCEAYALLCHDAPQGALFVDMNSIGPELAASIAEIIQRAGREFVDASVHGQAREFATSATLYVAGGRADGVAKLFDGVLRTRVLGAAPDDASAMKMLLGGLSKGLCALFIELLTLASRRSMTGDFITEATQFYPGLVSAAQRMLPTYPEHARRRQGEMNELEKTVIASDQTPCLISATRQLIELLAEIDFGQRTDPAKWDAQTLANYLCKNGFLANANAPDEDAPVVDKRRLS